MQKYLKYLHLPVIFKKASTGEVNKMESRGLLLGFASEGHYKDYCIKMDMDDIALIITDGITETVNKDGEQFGYESLSRILSELKQGEEIIPAVIREFEKFTSGKFDDDISLISIRKT
jgi:phosphoserine phosphatase RsbU/P